MLHSGHPFSAIAATLARRRRPKGEGSGQALPRPCADLGLLGGDEVQTLVKFVNLPPPPPQPPPLPPPAPLPWGEGGRRPGEGSAALGDPTLGGKRLLATTSERVPRIDLCCLLRVPFRRALNLHNSRVFG